MPDGGCRRGVPDLQVWRSVAAQMASSPSIFTRKTASRSMRRSAFGPGPPLLSLPTSARDVQPPGPLRREGRAGSESPAGRIVGAGLLREHRGIGVQRIERRTRPPARPPSGASSRRSPESPIPQLAFRTGRIELCRPTPGRLGHAALPGVTIRRSERSAPSAESRGIPKANRAAAGRPRGAAHRLRASTGRAGSSGRGRRDRARGPGRRPEARPPPRPPSPPGPPDGPPARSSASPLPRPRSRLKSPSGRCSWCQFNRCHANGRPGRIGAGYMRRVGVRRVRANPTMIRFAFIVALWSPFPAVQLDARKGCLQTQVVPLGEEGLERSLGVAVERPAVDQPVAGPRGDAAVDRSAPRCLARRRPPVRLEAVLQPSLHPGSIS